MPAPPRPDRLEMLRHFAEQTPTDPFPRYGLAMELKTRGLLDQAVAAFADLEARFPDYVPQYLMHVQVLASLRRLDDARAVGARGLAAAQRKGDSHALGELSSAIDGLGEPG